MIIFLLIGAVFVIIWEMFHGAISVSQCFCHCWGILWVAPGWNWRISIVSHISIVFRCWCYCHMAHRNHFFRLYQQNKSSESKVKFLQATNFCKSDPEAVKLAYTNKTKAFTSFQKLGSQDFWRIASSVLRKDKSAIPPLFNGLNVLSSAPDQAKLFAKNFSKNSNFDDSDISLLVFPCRTNLKLHNTLRLPVWLKKW